MENNNKVKVKFKLGEDHFIYLQIEESKLPIVKDNNREVARLEKRKIRHESIYSLEAITEENGVEMVDETTDLEKQMNEQETQPKGTSACIKRYINFRLDNRRLSIKSIF